MRLYGRVASVDGDCEYARINLKISYKKKQWRPPSKKKKERKKKPKPEEQEGIARINGN
jgi:hypothetical protein